MNTATSSFVDTSQPTQAFKRGVEYVNKLLGPEHTADSVNNEQLIQILSAKRTKKTNEPLTTNSFTYILSIIKKQNDKIKITVHDLPKHKIKNRISAEEETVIQKTIAHCISHLKNITYEEEYKKNRALYQMNIAVLLASSVCLRISEILQLTLENYSQILYRQPVAIRVKMRVKSPILLGNLELLEAYFPDVVKVAQLECQLFPQSARVGGPRLLVNISKTQVNKKFKEAAKNIASAEDVKMSNAFGMQSIRKVVTTIVLKETGSVQMAQRFARHENRETTTRHYNTDNFVKDKIKNVFSSLRN